MRPAEAALISAAGGLAVQNRAADVAALLAPWVEQVARGADASPAFRGVSFDLHCRALLSSRGHGEEVLAELARLCSLSETCFGAQPWSDLYRACTRHLRGDWAGAVPLYRRAAAGIDILWPSSVGCRSVIDDAEAARWLDAPADLPTPSPIDWLKETASAEFLIFLACDPSYLRLFWPGYILSVAQQATNAAVHLHIVDAGPEDAGWAVEQAGLVAPRLSISTERHAGRDARAWYATARFVRLPEMLRHYGCPVLVTDIDAAFSRALDPLIPDADVGLRVKRHGFRAHPWQTIQAGALAVRSTPRGQAFADGLRLLGVGSFAARARANIRFVDQNMLWAARRLLISGTDTRVADIGEEFLPGGLRFGKALA